MSDAIDAAERALSEARSRQSVVEAEIHEEVRKAEAEIRVRFDEALSAARQAVGAASRAVKAAKDEHLPDHPWTGKRVFKMEVQGWYYEHKPSKRVEGVVETVRSDTEFPANMASYSRPYIGAGIVRRLNKNGFPGARFEQLRGDYHGWQLAEDPAAAPSSATLNGALAEHRDAKQNQDFGSAQSLPNRVETDTPSTGGSAG